MLDPLLYILYMAEMFHIITYHGVKVHQYAGDTVCLGVLAKDAHVAVDLNIICLADVEPWLKASRLRLNPGKTRMLWLRLEIWPSWILLRLEYCRSLFHLSTL